MTTLDARLATPLPARLAVGAGSAIFLEGTCDADTVRIRALSVAVDGDEHDVIAHGMPPQGGPRPLHCWWAVLPLAPLQAPRAAVVELRARLADGSTAAAEVGRLELVPSLLPQDAAPAEASLAIAMATYEPPPQLFERQIESIRAQAHGDWVCVISDDGSAPSTLARMRKVVGEDSRFRLHSFGQRLGVYGNFERALLLVPPDVLLVALCDQDDYWYPHKLERLVGRLEDGALLVYSDTRVVSEEGGTIAETYWTQRRNNYTDLGSLLLANTVTGAASVFRRELLDYALPFPPRYRDSYHDHWLALCALALGRIDYIDEALYEYVQHSRSAIGHAEANLPGAKGRRRRAMKRAQDEGISHPHAVYSALRRYYFAVWCQTMVAATALEVRCGELIECRKRRAVRRLALGGGLRQIGWLAARSLRPRLGTSATFARERYVLLSLIWRRSVSAWAAATASRRVGRPRS